MTPDDVRRIAQDVYRQNNTVQAGILSQFALSGSGANGFLGASKTAGQTINQNPLTNVSNSTGYVFPVPVIYSGSFQGGDAPNGTIALFINGLTAQLWVRAYDSAASASRWYGVDFTSTNVNGAARVLGPIA